MTTQLIKEDCIDRDYLYGRLCAIAQLAESAYIKACGGSDDKRETNAERYMVAMMNAPNRTWNCIFKKLAPYLNKKNKAGFYADYYTRLIREVTNKFQPGDFESNKALSGLFLVGYSAQYESQYIKKETVDENI